MTPIAALILLPFATAIGVWVAWSDMKYMKIPNQAVLALLAVWLVVGIVAVGLTSGLQTWAWGLALAAAVLVAGFVASSVRLVGAGDAKFAAAMAPFFVHADYRVVLGLYAACLLGAFATHRLARFIPPLRRATADWASWTHSDFPMGLALAGTLIFYLSAKLLPLF